jgi:HD superfamily phosphohydrolase
VTSKEVRDPVHGLIELSATEWRVVDSPAFQRLRGVQQLAMTHLVYPGARHSRFEHCIGACHIAGRLGQGIGLDAAGVTRLRAAALCHDLGHGPFSHVSEAVFESRTGLHHVHERISAAIIRHHEPIRAALGEETSEWAAQLLEGSGHAVRRTAERDIVAGPADIDKLDYLLRDSLYCGVRYGEYDLDKIVESARLVSRRDASYLAYHRDGIFAVEAMLLARHHMHRQVYGHRTRVVTDRMLVRALDLGVDEGVLPESVFAPTLFDATFVEEYLTWDDARVTSVLTGSGGAAGAMMQDLMARRLLKRVVRLGFDELMAALDERVTVGYALRPVGLTQERVRDAEAAIADAAGVDPVGVVLHWEQLQNPVGGGGDSARVDDKDVLVTDDDGKVQSFSEVSEIFGQPAAAPKWTVSVYLRPRPGDDSQRFEAAARTREAAVSALRDIGHASEGV